jgi:hypothetical protein
VKPHPLPTDQEIAANVAEGAAVVRELRAAGLPIDNLRQLRNVRAGLGPYMPIVERWWRQAKRYSTKANIVAAFRRDNLRARQLVPELLTEFRSEPGVDPVYADDLAFALESVATRKHLEELVGILLDGDLPLQKRLGLLHAINKFPDQRMVATYVDLLADPEVDRYPADIMLVLSGLGRTRSPEALAVAKGYLKHEAGGVRQYARRAVARLERDIAARDTPGKGRP